MAAHHAGRRTNRSIGLYIYGVANAHFSELFLIC